MQQSGRFLNLGTTTPPQQATKIGASPRPKCDCGLSLRATSAPILVGPLSSIPSSSNHGSGGSLVGGGINGGGGGSTGGGITGGGGGGFNAHGSPSRPPIRSLSRLAIQQHLAASAAAANTVENSGTLMDSPSHNHAHQWSHQLFPLQTIKSSSTLPSYVYRWERKQTDTLDDCRVPSALVALARYVNPF